MNIDEEEFKDKFEAMGYTVLNSGWPDFLIMKDGVIAGVEKKSKHDAIEPNQQKMMNALSAGGIRCFVARQKWHEITNYMEMAGREDDILKKINQRYMKKIREIVAKLETTKRMILNLNYAAIPRSKRRSKKRLKFELKTDSIAERLDSLIEDIKTPPTKMLEQWFEK